MNVIVLVELYSSSLIQFLTQFFLPSGNLSRHCRQAHADMKEVRERATKEKFLCRRRGCDQKAFTSREVFIKHLEQHSGSKGVFPCGECSSVFSSSSNLSKHRKSQHGRKIKTEPGQQVKFSCDLCKTDFQNQALYHMHLRLVLREHSSL